MTEAGSASGEDEDAALGQAFEARAAEIRAMGDQVEAVHAAARLIGSSQRVRGLAAKLRTEMAERLKETEHLTIAQLADRLGITKGSAQILLEREKRAGRPPRVRRGVKRPQPPE